jgi:hypothetical protein
MEKKTLEALMQWLRKVGIAYSFCPIILGILCLSLTVNPYISPGYVKVIWGIIGITGIVYGAVFLRKFIRP